MFRKSKRKLTYLQIICKSVSFLDESRITIVPGFQTNNHYLNALFQTNIIHFNAFFQTNVSNHQCYALSRCIGNFHRVVVDAVTFYTATAVVEQHHWAVALQFVLEEVQRLITKIKLGGIVVRTVALNILYIVLCFLWQMYEKIETN